MSEQHLAGSTTTAELEVVPPPGRADTGGDFEELPGRPLRKRFGPLTYLLLAAFVACGAFYAGARLYKSTSGSGGAPSGLAAAISGLTGRGSSTTGASSTKGSSSKFSFPGGGSSSPSSGSSAPSGAFEGLGGGVAGTIKLVDGDDVYVEESTGTTVEITTSPATSVSVSSTGTVSQLHPGDTVVVTGTTQKDGSVSASRITDAGNAEADGSTTRG